MRFESEADVDRFLARFESGQIPGAEWTHAAHIALAGAYVLRYGDDAFYRIRAGIQHLNWHHGTISRPERGYHETLTIFWTKVMEQFCREHADMDRATMLHLAMEELPAGLYRDYYGFDAVRSVEARGTWMAPDLRELP